MKNKKLIFLSLMIICIAIWGIKKYYDNAATPAVNPVWVAAIHVREATIPLELQALGTLTARSVEITPELAGHIKAILFQDGSSVTTGTQLVQLDDAIYKTKYELAKAKLAYSETNYQRMTLLGKQGAISRQAIDQAEADLKEKKADADENKVMSSKMKVTLPINALSG